VFSWNVSVVYVQALETVWRMLKARGLVKAIPNGEVGVSYYASQDLASKLSNQIIAFKSVSICPIKL